MKHLLKNELLVTCMSCMYFIKENVKDEKEM